MTLGQAWGKGGMGEMTKEPSFVRAARLVRREGWLLYRHRKHVSGEGMKS